MADIIKMEDYRKEKDLTKKISEENLFAFVVESYKIEGEISSLADEEKAKYAHLFHHTILKHIPNQPVAGRIDLIESILPPHVNMREKEGCNVRVGNYFPPPGGPGIRKALLAMLDNEYLMNPEISAYQFHKDFEDLHPYTDFNGRIGRLLWLIKKVDHENYDGSRGFLHQWYYDSLQEKR